MSGAKSTRIGTVIGERFRLDELIGRGAMAEVYRALDLETQAFVALKILRHQHVTDSVSLARFEREGEVQARLRHRNIAALHEVHHRAQVMNMLTRLGVGVGDIDFNLLMYQRRDAQ